MRIEYDGGRLAERMTVMEKGRRPRAYFVGLAGRIDRLNGRATMWLARIAAAVLALLAVMTFCDVIARYFFNSPLSFTVEITEIAMGVIVYFGVGLVTQDNGHISVDIVTLRLSDWWRALLRLATNIAALGFLALMGTTAAASKLISRGRRATLATQVATAVMDSLRLKANEDLVTCTDLATDGTGYTSQGVSVTWTVGNREPAGNSGYRIVTVAASYAGSRGGAKVDSLITAIKCDV